MNTEEPSYGPLQMLLVGFETTERFRGEIARELLDLRGRGMIRVIDARFLYRARDGKVTEVDLGPLLADQRREDANPIARLLGVNGFGGNGGNGGVAPADAFARTAGFALEDLRRLTDEIGLGDYAAVVLVEHVWAAQLRAVVRRAGGSLRAQGLLTPEVEMLVGAELKARADAEEAIELAHAARGGRRDRGAGQCRADRVRALAGGDRRGRGRRGPVTRAVPRRDSATSPSSS
jgi:hypothetical protein